MYLDHDYVENQFRYICSKVLSIYIEDDVISSFHEPKAEEIRSVLSVLIELPDTGLKDASVLYPKNDGNELAMVSIDGKNLLLNLNVRNAIDLILGFAPIFVPDFLVMKILILLDIIKKLCDLIRVEIVDRDAAVLIFLYKLGADRVSIDESSAFSKLKETLNNAEEKDKRSLFYNACNCEYHEFTASITNLDRLGCLELIEGRIRICEKIKGIDRKM